MTPTDIPDDKFKQAVALFKRADKENPKPEDVRALQKVLRDNPDLWRFGGDLAQQAQNRILEGCQMTPGVKETIKAAISGLRRELGYHDSPFLEQLIIEQVLLSWLRLNLYEQIFTSMDSGEGMTLTKAAFWDKRLSAAQRRYLRACETLARVRRLARYNPALQVNIATQSGQQVNIAGDFVKTSEAG